MRKWLAALCVALSFAAQAQTIQPSGSGSGGTPGGPAGGDLSGTYPNPNVVGLGHATGAVNNGVTATTQTAGDASNDLATNAFVAAAIAPLNPASSVNEATTGALPNTPTYSNGTAGVGATLTSATNTALSIDSVATVLNGRYLVKNQASTFQNGIYTLTQVGTGSVPWILTRATDYNTPQNINYTGTVPVIAGTTNAGTNWLLVSTIPAVGSPNAITYSSQSTPPKNGVVSAAALTANGVIVGQGGQSVAATAVGTAGQAFVSNGGVNLAPSFQACPQAATSATASGCLGAPQNAQTSSYTMVAGDAAGLVNMGCTGACTLTIPANVSVAFPVGTVIAIANTGTASDTIAITSDTLDTGIGGTIVSGSLSLPVGATASIQKIGSTTWLASLGSGGMVCQKIITAGSQTSVIFSSIPGGYSHLLFKIVARSATSAVDDTIYVQFNNDTGANYQLSIWNFTGNSASLTAVGETGQNQIQFGNVVAATGQANMPGQVDAQIDDYSGSTFYKTVAANAVDFKSASAGSLNHQLQDGTWLNTAAITSIKLYLTSGAAFVNGGVFSMCLVP